MRLTSPRSAALPAAALAVVLTAEALAQTCPHAEPEAALRHAAEQKMAAFELTRDCAMIPELVAMLRRHGALVRSIERDCKDVVVMRGDGPKMPIEAELRQFCEAGPLSPQPPAKR